MKNKNFIVFGHWNLRGKASPFFLAKVDVHHDAQHYTLILEPYHKNLLPLIERKLNGILMVDDFKSYLFNIQNEKIILDIAPGKLGEVLQVLHSNRFINYETAHAILNHHHTLNSQHSFIQRVFNLGNTYEEIPNEAPTASFKLMLRT